MNTKWDYSGKTRQKNFHLIIVCRSEIMELYRVTIPKDDAWKVVEALGNTDAAHFIDLNKNEQPFNLPYATRIKLCDETERKLLFLIQKCNEYRIKMFKPSSPAAFKAKIQQIEEDKHKASHLLFDAIEADVNDKEEFVQRMSKQINDMNTDINKLDDYIRVLNFVNQMVSQLGGNARPAQARGDHNNSIQGTKEGDQLADASEPMLGGVSFISGTIRQEEQDRLKKMIFRATRGKALTYF